MDRGEFARRPIKARNTRWASRVANWLERLGVRPNTISVTSVFFAGAAGLCLVLTDGVAGEVRGLLFLMSGVLIQMRLLCNLFDGMVAVEGGHKTKSGEIYNELPDGWQMFSSLSERDTPGCAWTGDLSSAGFAPSWPC
jgi:hypothetical protein